MHPAKRHHPSPPPPEIKRHRNSKVVQLKTVDRQSTNHVVRVSSSNLGKEKQMAKNNNVKIHIQRVYESLLRDIIQYPPNTHLFPSPPPPNPIPIPSPHSPPSPHLLIPQSPTMHLNSPPPPQTSSRLSLPPSHIPPSPRNPNPLGPIPHSRG